MLFMEQITSYIKNTLRYRLKHHKLVPKEVNCFTSSLHVSKVVHEDHVSIPS